jgi:hypothetical protein
MHKVLIIFFLVFSTTNFFSQSGNSSNGYFVFKVNSGFFIDSDGKRFEHGNPAFEQEEAGLRCRTGKVISLKQDWSKNFVFPGGEITYYLPRDNFFGFNIGIAYSYDKTYCSYFSHESVRVSSNQFRAVIGRGEGVLNNRMFKLIFGFNFITKGGFNFYFQPLNPEIRFIKNGKSTVTFDTYEGYYFSGGNNGHCSPADSTYDLVATERKNFEYYNYRTGSNRSIAFPTLIGIEQKFKINKISCVAGLSGAFSILEWYSIYRLHIGVCFGDFKKAETQPGY